MSIYYEGIRLLQYLQSIINVIFNLITIFIIKLLHIINSKLLYIK